MSDEVDSPSSSSDAVRGSRSQVHSGRSTQSRSSVNTTPPPVQESASQNRRGSQTDVFEEKTSCVKKRTVEKLSNEVWMKLSIHLDPTRDFGGDYRDLADKFGYDMTYINYLDSQQSPTRSLLNYHLPLIEDLLQKIELIGRDDVLPVIRKWLSEQACNCTDCGSLR